MKNYFRILLLAALLPLAACTDYNFETPKVDSNAALLMDVGELEIIPFDGKDSNILPLPASEMTKQWFERKLKISHKGQKRFQVEIIEAQTSQNPSASSGKFNSYTTQIKVNYKLYEPEQNLARITADSSLKMTREIAKDASVADEDKFFAKINQQLLDRMNREFPTQIEKYFAQHIIMTR